MRFYLTFGSNHIHNGQALHNHYVTIEAPDEGMARGIAFKNFSDQWAFMYSESKGNFKPDFFPLGNYAYLKYGPSSLEELFDNKDEIDGILYRYVIGEHITDEERDKVLLAHGKK